MATIKAKIIQTEQGAALLVGQPVLDALKSDDGSTVELSIQDGGVFLHACDDARREKLKAIARSVMSRYAEDFRKLAQ